MRLAVETIVSGVERDEPMDKEFGLFIVRFAKSESFVVKERERNDVCLE
jgi:hypothetical protein